VIIPSIDLMAGQTVQLVGGARKELDAGDPVPIAERFRVAGEIAVVDLDAALGKGNNTELMGKLLHIAPCRVGGGIRDVETAIRWLDQGAAKVVLGTAARPEVLSKLPAERVVAALDAVDGEVVVEGWQKKTGHGIIERMQELKSMVGGFLVTFVEREGRLGGTALEQVQALVKAAAPARVTIAGGVTTVEEIAELDRMGADAQVGMALYTGRMQLADALVAPLQSDRPDGLYATVVVDERGVALGLAWSDEESVREAVRTGRGVYHSRKRGLWVKGESSGAAQELVRIDLDCDRDCLRFVVRQAGSGFCHCGTRTCWGPDRSLGELERTLQRRAAAAPEGSYTHRLLKDPALLASKLREEAAELAGARTAEEVAWESADLLYFTLVAAVRAGVPLSAIEAELYRRSLAITRRPGNAKPQEGT
jgi:phosphoribosyl-ATP pyrophosphohydrolase